MKVLITGWIGIALLVSTTLYVFCLTDQRNQNINLDALMDAGN